MHCKETMQPFPDLKMPLLGEHYLPKVTRINVFNAIAQKATQTHAQVHCHTAPAHLQPIDWYPKGLGKASWTSSLDSLEPACPQTCWQA